MPAEFTEVITGEDQLREIIGHPTEYIIQKMIPSIDDHCRMFIARSPFMLLASSDAYGHLDISPKGDPPGFVHCWMRKRWQYRIALAIAAQIASPIFFRIR